MPRKDHVGWFCEIPSDLKEEFRRLYPGRAAMRKITIAAIRWAISRHPSRTAYCPITPATPVTKVWLV